MIEIRNNHELESETQHYCSNNNRSRLHICWSHIHVLLLIYPSVGFKCEFNAFKWKLHTPTISPLKGKAISAEQWLCHHGRTVLDYSSRHNHTQTFSVLALEELKVFNRKVKVCGYKWFSTDFFCLLNNSVFDRKKSRVSFCGKYESFGITPFNDTELMKTHRSLWGHVNILGLLRLISWVDLIRRQFEKVTLLSFGNKVFLQTTLFCSVPESV